MELRAVTVRLEHLAHGLLEPLDERVAERVTEPRVRDDGGAIEEARGANTLRAVDDLRREHEVAGLDLLAEGPYRGEREDRAHAEGLECRDVCADWNRGWGDRVAVTVPCEEGDLSA